MKPLGSKTGIIEMTEVDDQTLEFTTKMKRQAPELETTKLIAESKKMMGNGLIRQHETRVKECGFR
jgi:hypothetical protein